MEGWELRIIGMPFEGAVPCEVDVLGFEEASVTPYEHEVIHQGHYTRKVEDDSMSRVVAQGDYIAINPALPPIQELDGQLVLVKVGDRLLFRRFGLHPMRLEPLSRNLNFTTQYVQSDDMAIQGVVEFSINDLRPYKIDKSIVA